MHFAKGALLFLSIALGGCASPPPSLMNLDRLAGPRMYAWDGSGRNPNLPRSTTGYRKVLADEGAPNHEREKILTSLRPNSAAWWAVHDQIGRARGHVSARSYGSLAGRYIAALGMTWSQSVY